VINQLQEVTLGWDLDAKAEKCYLEASVIAKPGTELANAMKSPSNPHSRFAGFGSADAAIVGNFNGQLPAIKVDILKDIFVALHKKAMEDIEKKEHDPAQAQAKKQLVDKLLPLLQDTITNGRIDKGLSVMLKPNAVTVVAGGAVVNNGRIEEIAKLVVNVVKSEHPNMADNIDKWVKLDAAKVGNLTIHTVSIPIPQDAKDREKVVSMIGETLEVVVGTSKDSVYIAAGRDPMDALKKAVEQSTAEASKSVPPMEITVSLSKIAEFIAVMGEPHERPRAAMMAAAFKQSPDSDHVILRAQPIDNGMQYRLEIEPGVLKAFGKLH
jgi:hypothetical protein